MKRWNGWGDETVVYPLKKGTMDFLVQKLGKSAPPQDVTMGDVAATVPPSRLPDHPLITTEKIERIRHARGQSLGDWIALRTGCDLNFPDGVAYPTTSEEVRELISYAAENGVKLIPYGGGTSVTGHINPIAGDKPVLTVDLSRLSALISLDETSGLATFGAGITGADLEAKLRAKGYTLGHFPQSFEYSTLGGWIVTRSKGQQSILYGGIEKMFAGGKLETPRGTMEFNPLPGTAAGPDLREMVLGSEGRMGILTEATVRISPLPETEEFRAVFFPDFESGMNAIRQIAQTKLPLSMLRLSCPVETETNLTLAGHRRLLSMVEWYLDKRGIGTGKCILMFGVTGNQVMVKATTGRALLIAANNGGVHVGQTFGKAWARSRFMTPYLRNTLWERGYAVDTVETATHWANVPAAFNAIETAIATALDDIGEKVHVFTHLSHVYPTGASLYTTYLYRIAPEPAETLKRWQKLKAAASEAMVANGTTISHQHGVGLDHKPYLVAEKGQMGIEAISQLVKAFDPEEIMNPGKLV